MDLLSHKTGIPEPTLRYLVCVLASYPLSLCYRGLAAQVHQAAEAGGGGGRGGKGHVVHMSAPKQPLFLLLLSLYNAAASLAVAVFFTRGNLEELSHSLLAVIVSWVICKQRILAPGLVGALFNFLYMLLCYYRFSSDGYNVNWLLPQCVLCLRMMGLCFDVGDGRQEAGSRKAPSISIRSNPEFQPIVPESSRALESCPSLLDTIGFSFYYGSFMAGPQFPFVIYKCHINNTLTSIEPPPNQALLSSVYSYSLRCFLMGVVYVVSSEIISSVLLPSSYMLSPAFLQDSSVLFRITYITIWGKFALHKYIGIWLLVEGGLCLSGITYNGYDEKLKTMRWDGMTNVKPSVLESVGSLNDVIAGFNINTNLWSKVYIFKRL